MKDPIVERDKVVSITYALHNESGELFEYTDLPVTYLHGGDSGLFDKIERSLEGLAVGEKVEVVLTPEEGFGERDPSLTFTDDLDNVPVELHTLGTELEARNAKGEALKFVVTEVDTENNTLTVDANHPLAGQTVRFDVTVQDIRDATPTELSQGRTDTMFGSTLQ